MSKASTRPSTALKSSSWECAMAVAAVKNSELSCWRWNFLFAMQGKRETWKHQAVSPNKEIKGQQSTLATFTPTSRSQGWHIDLTCQGLHGLLVTLLFNSIPVSENGANLPWVSWMGLPLVYIDIRWDPLGRKVARFDGQNFSTWFFVGSILQLSTNDSLIDSIQEWFISKTTWLVLTLTGSRKP